MKIYKLKAYGGTYKIALRKGTYNSNETLAVEMVLVNSKGKMAEPWNMLTVNINGSDIYANDIHAFIDTNNNGNEIVDWLVENDIAERTNISGNSGWCVYPLVKFKQQALAEMPEIE